MKFQANLIKSGAWWAVDFPVLDLQTQGKTKKEAMVMAGDVIKCMSPTDSIEVSVSPKGKTTIEVGSNNTKAMVSILLRARRQKHGLSIAEVSEKLGYSSRNSYAKYEQGKTIPSVEKLEELLEAMDASITFSEAQ
jgi:DNA-binding XRE family transcriptional regulator